MGLLDAILGGMMRGQPGAPTGMSGLGAQGESPLLQIALQLLQQHGGLQGVLGKFQQAGYGEQAHSWIGTGQNMPIDAGAMSQIFGQGPHVVAGEPIRDCVRRENRLRDGRIINDLQSGL